MQEIVNMIKKFLENNGWDYQLSEDNVFSLELELYGAIPNVCYAVIVSEDDYVVYAYLPNTPDKDAYPRIAEYLHRINCYMPYGNFELDYNEESIRYKVYTNCEYCPPSYAVVDRSMNVPAAMIRAYGKNLLRAMYGNEDVAMLAQDATENGWK